MNYNIIAIDGPAGSGKSTIAREIANKKDFYYFDSGALYRAVTLYFMRLYSRKSKTLSFESWLSEINLQEQLDNLKIKVEFSKGKINQIYLNEEDVSEEIRNPEVTSLIKYFSNNKLIRKFVNDILHELAKNYKLVIDGRDIGTEVFPNSANKFFLTANAETRAKRRQEEWRRKGLEKNLDEILTEIIQRDKADSEREIAPLRKADDAIEIDTSNLSVGEVTHIILKQLKEQSSEQLLP
ncbi:MAG: (d)CMP kinase [Leptospiraceae bacterium]|nr:(d)CMP kinase [Leptospiraceae bacterium]